MILPFAARSDSPASVLVPPPGSCATQAQAEARLGHLFAIANPHAPPSDDEVWRVQAYDPRGHPGASKVDLVGALVRLASLPVATPDSVDRVGWDEVRWVGESVELVPARRTCVTADQARAALGPLDPVDPPVGPDRDDRRVRAYQAPGELTLTLARSTGCLEDVKLRPGPG